MSDNDYYRSRAQTARQLADTAASDAVRAIHLEMADRYDLLAERGGRNRATLRVVTA